MKTPRETKNVRYHNRPVIRAIDGMLTTVADQPGKTFHDNQYVSDKCEEAGEALLIVAGNVRAHLIRRHSP
jgi:hypothetical protein